MSAHKLYMAMRNMLSLAIPGHDWTDDTAEAALQDAHAACKDYEDRLANVLDTPETPEALRQMWRAFRKSTEGKWSASKTDGMLTIPGHDTVEFDDGDNAEFCAVAHNSMIDLMRFIDERAGRSNALRAEIICQRDAVARRDQQIAAQQYIISKLDDIIYNVKNADLMRMIVQIDARHTAEQRLRTLEAAVATIKDIPGVRERLEKHFSEIAQQAIDALRVEEYRNGGK